MSTDTGGESICKYMSTDTQGKSMYKSAATGTSVKIPELMLTNCHLVSFRCHVFVHKTTMAVKNRFTNMHTNAK